MPAPPEIPAPPPSSAPSGTPARSMMPAMHRRRVTPAVPLILPRSAVSTRSVTPTTTAVPITPAAPTTPAMPTTPATPAASGLSSLPLPTMFVFPEVPSQAVAGIRAAQRTASTAHLTTNTTPSTAQQSPTAQLHPSMTPQEASEFISRLLDNWPGLPAGNTAQVTPSSEGSSAEEDHAAMEP
ncbi:hypothetical protein TgHK011_000537 [Trichoderma gracile]|nr:hypothetical protein TgHK011_000537 [Trichoderma gracile]